MPETKKVEEKEPSWRDYVKPELRMAFYGECHMNCMDFYSCGVVLTVHLVLDDLMEHTYKGTWNRDKKSPKQAWESAMKQNPYHSGMTAAAAALMIAHYSPRGEEFKKWCKDNDIVCAKWS